MAPRRRYFRRTAVFDFEYEIADGGLPNVLCLVCYLLDENLRLVEVVQRWRGELGRSPPFPIDDDTLAVGYSLWAEMTCFQVLGWQFPRYVYDLHTAYLATSNILLPYEPDTKRTKTRKGLSDACAAYGIEGWEAIDKPELAKAIGEGRWRELWATHSVALLRGGCPRFGRVAAPPTHWLPPFRRCRSRSVSCTGATTPPRPSP